MKVYLISKQKPLEVFLSGLINTQSIASLQQSIGQLGYVDLYNNVVRISALDPVKLKAADKCLKGILTVSMQRPLKEYRLMYIQV